MFHPEYEDCGPPNPCSPPHYGVCCVGEDCYVATEAECEELEGEWHPDWPGCGGRNPCASLRACCIGETCELTSDYECYLLGGEWHTEWTSCDPNPCLGDTIADLTGGVFLCHHDPDVAFTTPPEGWCEAYLEEFAIEDPAEQHPSITTSEECVWFVLSAFAAQRRWCGTTFGFGEYDPTLFLFTGWGACAPAVHLEIPTDNWPGPREGTAFVTTGDPWQGDIEPVYYFTGYIDPGAAGQLPLDVNPDTGSAGWGNCRTPPEIFEAACLPAMGMQTDGLSCYPEIPLAVCCVGEECYVLTREACDDLGGDFHPELTDCEPPNPCELPDQAVCCVGEDCYVVTELECTDLMGEWHPEWTECDDPNPCATVGVCCIAEVCVLATEDECADLAGEWHPEWETCDPNPCPSTPVDFVGAATLRQEGFAAVLRWQGAPDPRVNGYQILRGEGAEGPPQPLARIDPTEGGEQGYRDETVAPRQRYRYWIAVLLSGNEQERFGPWSITITGGLHPELLGISPNPIVAGGQIRFYLPHRGDARLSIVGANGRQVHRCRLSALRAGAHVHVWDGRDASGREVAGGVYWVRLAVGHHEDSRKVVVLR
ncbi:MAG: hypothetical protein GF330_08875 [Candidatus Eisenbacteria bacterium]|nr:hypothetical protein [Candidatus Eisenbacteria bacterium]